MGLETGTYIDDFVVANPAGTDDRSTADDHLRLIKTFIKNTFPQLTGAMTATQAELNRMDGITASTAELNIMDGVLASFSELNLLNGSLITTAELNYLNDVTSLIQAQINGKAASAHSHTGSEISALDAGDTTTGVFDLARIPTIDQAKLGSAAVGQGELITTSGTQSTSSFTYIILTLPGGEYGFYPKHKSNDNSNRQYGSAFVQSDDGTFNLTSSNLTRIHLRGGNATITAEQRYIQASPPYDLGDGEIPLFIFVEVDKNGKVISAYEAPEAPWHYNGPTSIKADGHFGDGSAYKMMKDPAEIDASLMAAGYSTGLTLTTSKELSLTAYDDYLSAFRSAKTYEVELTQAIKNADMALIPRPMEPRIDLEADPTVENTVVMLDPMSDLTLKLFELKQHEGFSLSDLLHDGDLIVDNVALTRSGPPGVDVVAYRFR